MNSQKQSQLNTLSLFSGCGGLDLGLANATSQTISTDIRDSPFNFIWSNDILDHSCESLSNNFGKPLVTDSDKYQQEDIVYCGDVREVQFDTITEKSIDVIIGGFPCQDFSVLQGDENREGVKVERGRLYLEFVRSLAELQPKIFVAENVKGLLSANDGKAYERILKDFTELSNTWRSIEEDIEDREDASIDISIDTDPEGYTMIHTDVVDFSSLGVPQTRERLTLIGVRNDLLENIGSPEELSESVTDSLNGSPVLQDYPLPTMETFTGQPLDNLQTKYKNVMKAYEEYLDNVDSDRAIEYRTDVWPTYSFRVWDDFFRRAGVSGTETANPTKIHETHKKILQELGYWRDPLEEKKFPDNSNQEMTEQSHVLERLRHIPPNENYRMVEDTEHHVTGMMSNTYRRIHPLEPSKTILASGGGGTWGYHYEIERGKLTNRERARIQSFPDDYHFSGSNAEVRKQIGNAVPPLGAKRIGEEVIHILDRVQTDEHQQ
jgi:DNA (cytosine-5)-methyltransferase 1